METYPLPAQTVSLALFSHLKNATEIRTRLITASTLPNDTEGNLERSKLEFAFVDASMITSRLHILTAINSALIAVASKELKTNSIYSELLFCLDPATNISDSLKHFGLSSTTTSVLVVSIGLPGSEPDPDDEDELLIKIKDVVEGELGEIDSLGKLPLNVNGTGGTNVKALKKIYKLNQDKVLIGLVSGSEEERLKLDELCIGTVALQPVAA